MAGDAGSQGAGVGGPAGMRITQTDQCGEKSNHDRLERIEKELRALRRILDEFAGAYLNAKFPFGRPNDRWAPPRDRWAGR